jgi:16S rRNA (guanine966-N2)-methyltransferase
MRLRIVSGELGSRVIVVPASTASFRPTLERHRQSVAEVLKGRVDGARVADLCAGSGAVGFELLSRGAAAADFVESDRKRARLIEQHAGTFGMAERCRVFVQDVRAFLRRHAVLYDIVYFDPPYGSEPLAHLVPDISARIADAGVLVHERSSAVQVPPLPADVPVRLTQTREYGAAAMDFYELRP